MKICYLALVLCLFASCKKDCTSSSDITGQWIWFKSTGGLAGVNLTPQNTGKTWGLKLNRGLSCIQTGDFVNPGYGVYTLTQESFPTGTAYYLTITFPNSDEKYNYSFSQDTLRLDDNIAADGLSHFFVKK